MKIIEEICELINNGPFLDFIVVGYAGHLRQLDKYMTFWSTDNVYFQFNNKYLHCYIRPIDDARIRMSIKDEINLDFGFEIEEDDKYCVFPFSSLFWGDREKNFIDYFRVLVNSEEELNDGLVEVIEFGIKHEKTILLDPLNINGLKLDIGGTLETWKDSFGVESKFEKSKLKEYIWKREESY